MEAKELRSGNKIWRPCCYDEVLEIRENGIIGLDSLRGLISYSEIEPIPITEEMLLKIGFDEPCDGVYEHNYGEFEVTKEQEKWWVTWNGGSDFWFEIKHLHQLQNAYYLVTGKEFEIKI